MFYNNETAILKKFLKIEAGLISITMNPKSVPHHHKPFIATSLLTVLTTFIVVVLAQNIGIIFPSPSTDKKNSLESLPIGQSRFSNSTTSSTIWQPTTSQPFHLQVQISEEFKYPEHISPDINVYDIDGEQATKEIVAKIHASNPSTKVVCNMNVGAYESYRSDFMRFPLALIGKADNEWAKSNWLDIRRSDILIPIIKDRMATWCQAKGFDAIDPDQSEVWNNDSGFSITKSQNDSYNIQIANLAHSMGLSVGLKNNISDASILYKYYDWSIVEQCMEFNSCMNVYNSFITHQKAVFDIEYHNTNSLCNQVNKLKINIQKRDINLVSPQNKDFSTVQCIANSVNKW